MTLARQALAELVGSASSLPPSSAPASFNPVVTLVEAVLGRLRLAAAAALVAAQVVGGLVGVVTANLMFGLPAVHVATHVRSGGALWFSASVATAGLVLVVFAALRAAAPLTLALAVGGYITGVYWFTSTTSSTSSTSFANPAVTIARSLSDSFAGIAPGSVPMFVLMQLVGGAAGYALVRALFPALVVRSAERRTTWTTS